MESDKLATLKAANAELEREVERYQQRQVLLEKVQLVKQKLAWMRVAVKNDEKEQLNEELKKQLEEVVRLKVEKNHIFVIVRLTLSQKRKIFLLLQS